MPTVTVLGLAYDSPITQFPVRSGPGTNFLKTSFKARKGLSGLKVLEVEPDANEVMSDFGRVYNWFHLEFPDGQHGWLRDHVIGIEGDFSQFGYGYVAPQKHAYLVIRDPSTIPAPVEAADTVMPTSGEVSPGDAKSAEEGDESTLEMFADATVQTVKELAQRVTSEISAVVMPDSDEDEDKSKTDENDDDDSSLSLFTDATIQTAKELAQRVTSEISAIVMPDSDEASTDEPETAETPEQPIEVAKKRAVRMKPTDPATVIIRRAPGTALNARNQPTTIGSSVLFTIPTRAVAKLLEVQRQDYGQKFRWFKVDYEGQQAWVREDFCRVAGDAEELGLSWDLYPSPMKDEGWWVRDYNYKPYQDPNVWEHLGWDFGAPVGTPIYCGPEGGEVVQVMDCTKCSAARPSTVLNGISLGDSSVYSDPGWGYGYGNFVVVGYEWDILPDSTQEWMLSNGYGGGAAFVLYGHLHERKVAAGQKISEEQIIGTCGNTGNSEASHLHLEMRLSKSPQYPGWASLSSGLTNPVILFSR